MTSCQETVCATTGFAQIPISRASSTGVHILVFFQEDYNDDDGNPHSTWLFGSDAADSILVQMHQDAFKNGKPVFIDDITHLQGFSFLLRPHQAARLRELSDVAVEQLGEQEEGEVGDSAAPAAEGCVVVASSGEGGSSGSAGPPAKKAKKAPAARKVIRKPKAPAPAGDELSALLM